MNILILNRNKAPELTDIYQSILSERGHKTTVLSHLRDSDEYVSNPSRYLGQFDIALAHPTNEDARALNKELTERENFRTVIFNISGEQEMNGRLGYATPLSRDDLINLIEN